MASIVPEQILELTAYNTKDDFHCTFSLTKITDEGLVSYISIKTFYPSTVSEAFIPLTRNQMKDLSDSLLKVLNL